MNILFMGTPEFAVPSLKELIRSKHKVIGVVSQPDKPKGRGKKVLPPPVKVVALENSIPVLQPPKIKDENFYKIIRDISPDIICVVAYGKIIPKDILEIPPYGCVNVHASLLPKYRGAAPINWAIIKGEKVTGVTTMLMDEGMDTGDILLQEKTEIGEDETSEELSKRLSVMGAKLLLKTIDLLLEGKIEPKKQNDKEATYAPMLKKEHGLIDWRKSAEEIRNLIRGTQPWPGAYTWLWGKTLKIFSAKISNMKGKPGEVLRAEKEALTVATGKGSLDIMELQLEGGKRLKTDEFLRGRKIAPGTVLGEKHITNKI